MIYTCVCKHTRRCAGCPTACAGCDQCSHNNDTFLVDAEHDGKSPEKAIYMTPGGDTGNFFTPPCLAGPCSCCNNKGIFGITELGVGKPVKPVGAPCNEMSR